MMNEEDKPVKETETLHEKVDALGKWMVASHEELMSLLRSDLAQVHRKLNTLQNHVK